MKEDILKEYGLKKTQARTLILECLQSKEYALSHKDLEEALSNELDRVTIYRTLNSFEEKGIVHKVLNEDGVSYYAVCQNNCDHHHHHDNHIHFHCISCRKIYCLSDFNLSGIKIPAGFSIKDTDLKIEGLCKHC